jgi:hypothetical protein
MSEGEVDLYKVEIVHYTQTRVAIETRNKEK